MLDNVCLTHLTGLLAWTSDGSGSLSLSHMHVLYAVSSLLLATSVCSLHFVASRAQHRQLLLVDDRLLDFSVVLSSDRHWRVEAGHERHASFWDNGTCQNRKSKKRRLLSLSFAMDEKTTTRVDSNSQLERRGAASHTASDSRGRQGCTYLGSRRPARSQRARLVDAHCMKNRIGAGPGDRACCVFSVYQVRLWEDMPVSSGPRGRFLRMHGFHRDIWRALS